MSRYIQLGLLLLLSSLLFILISCGKEPEVEEVIRPVRYQQVYVTGGERVRTFSGAAQASQESRLSFRVGGTVEKIAVKVGDQVKTGQLIAELDPYDYNLKVQEAEASLAQADAQKRNAEANYERVRKLYENRNASRNDLDAARAASESADAQVKTIQKRLELAESQLNYTKLMAPTSGAIATVESEVNENVGAGETVVQLSSGSNIEVHVAVPGVLISQVREGEKVTVTFDAIPQEKLSARVTEVGVTSGGFATTFPVTVRLEESNPGIRPGMSAEVIIKFGSERKRERFIVRSVAVGEDRQGKFLFVVEPTELGFGIVKRKAVTIGEFTEDGIEILEGLIDGELVVTAGTSQLVDGQKVKLPAAEER